VGGLLIFRHLPFWLPLFLNSVVIRKEGKYASLFTVLTVLARFRLRKTAMALFACNDVHTLSPPDQNKTKASSRVFECYISVVIRIKGTLS
jgi:hypothetical protein